MTHKNERVLSVRSYPGRRRRRLVHPGLGGAVTETRLDIFEPPRFFEALLRGRAYTEPPDITARICGICPAPTRRPRARRSRLPSA